MDPGTALGVVSLGIQVCQGITWYYGEWKDCPEDVAGVAKSAESLGKTFELFNLVRVLSIHSFLPAAAVPSFSGTTQQP